MRLTAPQVELLTDIATKPVIYVRHYSRWGRTAGSLVGKGLAVMHYCWGDQSEVVITDDGRQEAARRGLALSDKAGPRRCSSCERSGGDLTENGCPEHGDNDLAG